MKIINKSGKADCNSGDSFFIILSPLEDSWEGGEFECVVGSKFATEEEAIDLALLGNIVAKVTLVAKIA